MKVQNIHINQERSKTRFGV